MNHFYLNQDPKGLQDTRGIKGQLDLQVKRGYEGKMEPLVLQESVAPVAQKDTLEAQDAEVLLGLLVKKVMMVLMGKMALQGPLASQVTRGLPEILVHLVQEETRDKMEYQDLLEKKEPWELLELDPGALRGRKVNLGMQGRGGLLVPAVLLVPLVLEEIQVVLVLLDLLVLLVVLVRRETALKGAKEKMDSPEDKDQKVPKAHRVPPVLQVLVLRETKDTKGHQVNQDHLVALVTLAHKACRVETDLQAHLDSKA